MIKFESAEHQNPHPDGFAVEKTKASSGKSFIVFRWNRM
jgi:hypothetical protein